MYSTIVLIVFLELYLLFLVSPFVGRIRRWILKESDIADTTLYKTLEGIQEHVDGYRHASSFGELFINYLISIMLLGLCVSMFVALFWPVFVTVWIFALIFKLALTLIRNKTK